VLDLFEQYNIIDNVNSVAPYLEKRLDELVDKYDFVTKRRGRGLMQGLVFDRPVADIIVSAMDKGLILINAGPSIIRFVPPLVISKDDVDKMIEILDSCLREI
jgi:acetylornithine/N-succinyldiaminopimelate aminotransferase